MKSEGVQTEDLSKVRSFWNTEACGTHFVQAQKVSREFYEHYRKFRYETEWHIPELVPFGEVRDKKVLEIGCGNGADGALLALNGAEYTGVDLTQAAVDATRTHFKVLELSGQFQVENAERLSFTDESFDWVYSHGVLHHTPHPETAIAEVFRVLKPGGQAIVMLYHKMSFNYWIRIMGYMRLRSIAKVLSRTGKWGQDRVRLSQNELQGLRGNEGGGVYRIHYENFIKQGWSYFRRENFVHHATDGPECPYAFAYSKKEALTLFKNFEQIRFKVAHFPLRKYRWGRFIPFGLERILASMMGWYLFVYATKYKGMAH